MGRWPVSPASSKYGHTHTKPALFLFSVFVFGFGGGGRGGLLVLVTCLWLVLRQTICYNVDIHCSLPCPLLVSSSLPLYLSLFHILPPLNLSVPVPTYPWHNSPAGSLVVGRKLWHGRTAGRRQGAWHEATGEEFVRCNVTQRGTELRIWVEALADEAASRPRDVRRDLVRVLCDTQVRLLQGGCLERWTTNQ